jgi:hypothetical protein
MIAEPGATWIQARTAFIPFEYKTRRIVMSMIGNFRTTTDAEIQSLLAEPQRIKALLYSDSPDLPDGVSVLDIDKAWQGIHFLLCGDAWDGGDYPLNFILASGTLVGDIDVGYGPARVFTSVEVAEIARVLEPLTSAELRTRFDAGEFTEAGVYPSIWDDSIEECLDEYVLHYFGILKEFVLKARDDRRGLIVYLN